MDFIDGLHYQRGHRYNELTSSQLTYCLYPQTPLDMQWVIREPVDDTFEKVQEQSSLEQVEKTKSEELLDIGNI